MHSSESSPQVEPVPLPGSSGEQCITKRSQRRKKNRRNRKEAGTRIKEALAHLRDRRTLREREREIFYICFRKKNCFCLGCIIQYSENTDRFCLQKQKCFIIRGLSADSKTPIVSRTVSCFCQISFFCYSWCQNFQQKDAGPRVVF